MSLAPQTTNLILEAESLWASPWSYVTRLLSARQRFSPEESLAATPGIDPRFLPRAPMSAANLDVGLLSELSKFGLKRAKEITAETHPELYQAWQALSARRGLQRAPQLILAESKSMNASSIDREDAVVLNSGLLKRFSMREVLAVLGHELGHEASGHTTSRVASAWTLGAIGILFGNRIAHRGGVGPLMKIDAMKSGRWKKFLEYMFEHDGKPLSVLGAVWYMIVGHWIGTTIANHISVRPTELDADAKGVAISGDPEALISALTKLEESREHGWMDRYRRLRSGYPSTETRIRHIRAIAASMPHLQPVATDLLAAEKTTQAATLASEVPTASMAEVPGAKIRQVGNATRVEPGPIVAAAV